MKADRRTELFKESAFLLPVILFAEANPELEVATDKTNVNAWIYQHKLLAL